MLGLGSVKKARFQQNGSLTHDESTVTREQYHALKHWSWIWHMGFYAILLTSTVVALFEADKTWDIRSGAMGLSFLLGVWHAVGILSEFGRHSEKRRFRLIGYVAVSWAIWIAMVALQEDYELVAFGLLIQLFAFTGIRWAITGCLSLVTLLILVEVVIQGTTPGPWLLRTFVPEAFLIILMLYMDAIEKRSAERQRLIIELESTRARLASSEREAGALQERERLAGEIHDTLAQGFTSIIMHHEAAEPELSEIPDLAKQHLDQAKRTARDSLAEARRLVWALRPEALERASLPEAMENVAGRWSEEGDEDANVVITGTARPLHPSAEVTLLRATQEALANARKHAKASQVNVTLSYMEDEVILDVQDDGVGFNPTDFSDRSGGEGMSGFGLSGMRQRVQQIHGTLVIESAPGEGTTLVIEVPIGDYDDGSEVGQLQKTAPEPARSSKLTRLIQ